ncbi:hypothetical protein GGI22_002836 [Coemansia erecta]|nr:hypothetical protein GGI22_002836 [Coemansia erecta]
MPPRKTRKAAPAQSPATSRRGRKSEAPAIAADPQPVTPVGRQSRKGGKSGEIPPPPDTVGMTRRTRRASVENIPEPSPSPAKPRRSPRKIKAKAAVPKAAAAAAAPRGRRKTTGASVAALGLESNSAEPNDNHVSGTVLDDGLDSADEALLATPTRTRGGAKVSLLQPNDGAVESDGMFIEILKESPEKKQTKQPGKRGRKRKSLVEAEILDADNDTADEDIQRSPLAGRGPKRLRSAEPSDELVFDAEPLTPTRTRYRGRDVANEGNYLDIASPSRFERSRALIAAPKQHKTAAKASQSDEPDKWREKYNDLFSLRFTKAEGDYKDFRRSAEERFQAADDLIENLRKEIGELKLKAKRKQDTEDTSAADQVSEMAAELQQRRTNEKELEKQVTQLTQSVETLKHELLVKDESIERLEQHRKMTETSTDYNLREKLKAVQEVTGFSVEDVVAEDEGVSYMCKQSGSSSTASYVLTVFDDMPNEYQYTPYGETTSMGSLPEYFKEPMSFERASASMFFWRMCDHLHHDPQAAGAAAKLKEDGMRDSQPQPDFASAKQEKEKATGGSTTETAALGLQ